MWCVQKGNRNIQSVVFVFLIHKYKYKDDWIFKLLPHSKYNYCTCMVLSKGFEKEKTTNKELWGKIRDLINVFGWNAKFWIELISLLLKWQDLWRNDCLISNQLSLDIGKPVENCSVRFWLLVCQQIHHLWRMFLLFTSKFSF